MTDVAVALYNFWNSFGIPAYVEDNVPDDAELPYITYELSQPDWKDPSSYTARVWYKGWSLVDISSKVDLIKNTIGECVSIRTNSGSVVLYPDTKFSQFQPISSDDVMVVYLSMIMLAHTN